MRKVSYNHTICCSERNTEFCAVEAFNYVVQAACAIAIAAIELTDYLADREH